MYTTLHQLSQYKVVIGAQPVETNVQQKCTQLYTGYPNIKLSLGHNLWKQMSSYPSIRLSLGHNLWKQMSHRNVYNFKLVVPVQGYHLGHSQLREAVP